MDQFVPYNPDSVTCKSSRNLPHWASNSVTYFVTFRAADSLPQTKLRALKEERKLWLECHPKPWSLKDQRNFRRLFEGRVQDWLDQNYGACLLRLREVGGVVEESMRYFDSSRYILDEFSVMPNHVHSLVKPLHGWTLPAILHSWKSYSATSINRMLGRQGRLWMDESFDHIVRSVVQLEWYRDYIRENPRNARLAPDEAIVGRGSGLVIVE